MEKRLPDRMKQALCLLCLITALPLPARALSESGEWSLLREAVRSGKREEISRKAEAFLRHHPRSRYAGEARLHAADSASNPSAALKHFRSLLASDEFRNKDYAAYRLCQIHYLLSRWKELKREADAAARNYRKSPYRAEFLQFSAKAGLYLDQYRQAGSDCREIMRQTHDYNRLAGTLVLMSFIAKNRTGYSRSFYSRLREHILGFGNSETAATAVYLLGKSYEERRDYNRAYSAYRALLREYPRSPEAQYAEKRISPLLAHRPKEVDYIPTDDMIEKKSAIDIQPEIELPEDEQAKNLYAVSLGPFGKRSDAAGIARLIGREFSPVKIVRLRDRYIVYAGMTSSSENAFSLRVRLAEQAAVNGRIVRIYRDSSRQYIYGD